MSRGQFGELRTVDDVPGAFAELAAAEAPRSIALSGGDTARACYSRIAASGADWSDTTVCYGDERWVALDHPDSNAGMATAILLDTVHPGAHHPMYAAGLTIDEGAAAYGRLLRELGPVELVHLGLGPDGHTASLFPGSPALDERRHRVVVTQDAEHPHPRLTVTYPWLETARLVVFTVVGEEKRDAFARIGAGEDLPATRVRAERVIWLVDPAASA